MSTYHPSHRRIRAGASGVFTAATAIGLLTVPVPAQAAPACAEYKFNGDYLLNQTNGWSVVLFNPVGPVANGRALATNNVDKMEGSVSGGIQGRNVDFTIQWDSGPRGHYTGTAGDDALVRNGFSINQINADSANWNSVSRLECVPPPAPAPKPQIPGEAKIPKQDSPFPKPTDPVPQTAVNVARDTDVYDKPSHQGGRVILVNGQKLFLDGGVDQVKLVGGCTKQIWCIVTNPKIPLPNNTGAVWGGDLDVPAG